MGDGIGPEAYAAYDARKLAAHEPGTWPAFRDGYAAGLAARTPGPATAKLLEVARDWVDGKDVDLWDVTHDFVMEHEAAKGAGG